MKGVLASLIHFDTHCMSLWQWICVAVDDEAL